MAGKRFTCVILSLLTSACPAWAQPVEWEQAWGFRDVAGLAPADLAAVGVARTVLTEQQAAELDVLAANLAGNLPPIARCNCPADFL